MLDAILSRGYLKEGEKDWNDIALRVSNFCGGKEMYHAMIEKKLIPASPFLLNAGTNDPQLFSCFVLPIEDSLKSIFKFYDDAATIFKSSGGVGANWSALRPKGAKLSNGGETSGVVSFMGIFNEVIEVVKQGGVKKGAAMCCLNIEHPEAEDFIRMKLEKGKFKNFNISPVMTDDYMRRAIKGDEQARKMIDLIVDCTWECSEPGMLFIDTANKDNTVPGLEAYDSTNPCGEEWLFHYESCCLCGLSLVPFVRGNEVNWKDLESVTRIGIRFLDKAIDKNKYPLPEIEEATKKTRKLGLYVLGVADVLIEANLGYDTKEGRAFIESIWKFINEVAWDESVKLGKKYGTFPAYSLRNPDLVPNDARNAAVTCAAPGGTTSFIAGANYGIEPFTSFVSDRRNGAGEGIITIPHFEQMLDKVCPEFKEEALKHCLQTGSIEDLPYIPSEVKKVFKSAFTIHWKAHIDMVAMFQKHCRAGSISKTVNLPASATKDDIREAYFYAWKSKCKGVTFYREGTRDAVYNLKKDEIKVTGPDYEVPKKAPAMRYNVTIGCGKMAIIVVGDPVSKEPIEVFIIPLTGGGCAGHCSGEGRTISNALQYGVPPSKFISSLSKVVCKACANKEKLDGKSCPDAMGRKLAEYIRDSKDLSFEIHQHIESGAKNSNKCPDCGTIMEHTEGCITCRNCGYSKCQ